MNERAHRLRDNLGYIAGTREAANPERTNAPNYRKIAFMSFPDQLIGNIRLNHASRAPLVSTTAQQSERGNDMDRRQCLGAMLLAAAATIAPAAWAQDSYPSRPVKLVVGFPPGTPPTLPPAPSPRRSPTTRPALHRRQPARRSEQHRGQSGRDFPRRRIHDLRGHDREHDQRRVSQLDVPRPGKEFAPVTMVGSVPNVLVAHPSLGVKSVNE